MNNPANKSAGRRPNWPWNAPRPFGGVRNRWGEPGGGVGLLVEGFFKSDIVIGGGGDVMSSIFASHFIRLMEGLDRSPFVPVCECVCPSIDGSFQG